MANLTVGMCCYDDFHGVYFTVQSLRSSGEKINQILIIDNNPSSQHGRETQKFARACGSQVKYIKYQNKKSTSIRNQIFKYATQDYVLSLDCHVLLFPQAITALHNYYDSNKNTKNLIHGPLFYDDVKSCVLQMKPVWRSYMYGIWSDVVKTVPVSPFQIQMHGLGLFSCKRSQWLGFNQKFQGFGGQQGYIHKKFQNNGGKIICLPDLKWIHRFQRPQGIKYPNNLQQRFRNYIIGWSQVGIPLQPCKQHFKSVLGQQKINLIINQINPIKNDNIKKQIQVKPLIKKFKC